MKYIKVILTIISVLLALNIVKSMISSASALNETDVNISQIGGSSLYGWILDVRIID